MKSVLISIQPRWCELIASGKKTVEVRKTKPKMETPFKCYIYCTKDKHGWFDFLKKERLDGKVIGEFVCYGIEELYQCNSGWVREYACISQNEFFDYLGIPRGTHLDYDKQAYGWRISDLVIYDKPKELSEFHSYNCGVKFENGYPIPTHEIKRPPQSWCYVEEGGAE